MSSNNNAISVRGLGKSYSIVQNDPGHSTLGEAVMDRLRRPFQTKRREEFWALRDLSFNVARGEVLGVIGRNGAGKSTLLKLLSRITEPTEGEIDLYGRVGSLLEVGTGFHPELTGRENIYLNGSILGMTRREIARSFEAIVDFSGVERFLDTPVKRYSSGMYVRLAFAVAAHLEPDILIVDEVLAVGDAGFQKKCLGKMGDVAREGRTVLFVSHNMEAVSTLTDRCLVLSGGEKVFLGRTNDAIGKYNELSDYGSARIVYTAAASAIEPRVTRVELHTSKPGNVQFHGESLEVHIEISTPRPLEEANTSFQVMNYLGQPVMWLWNNDLQGATERRPGVFRLVCHIPKTRLYIGTYQLVVHFGEHYGRTTAEKIEGICPFEVVKYGEENDFGWRPNVCTYIEDCEWHVSEVQPEALSMVATER